MAAISTFFILLSIVILLLIKLKRNANKAKQLDKQLFDFVKILAKDDETQIFQVNNTTGEVYKYESGQYKFYSKSIDEHVKNIHTRDLKNLKYLIDKISVEQEDYATCEFRYFNSEKRKYCYYDFVFLVTERAKNGKILNYIFSQRDCSLTKEVATFQKNLLDNLNHSMTAGELSRWFYDIKNKQCNIVEYKGKVYEFDNNVIDYVIKKDREKLLTYISDLIAGCNTSSYVEVRLRHPKSESEHLCRLSGTVEYDNEKNPVFIHGIWKDITEIYNINKELEDFKRNTTVALKIGNLATWSYDCKERKFYMLGGAHKGNYSDKGIPRETFFIDYIHPEDREVMLDSLDKLENYEQESIILSFRYKIFDEWRWILSSTMAIQTDGVVTSVMGIRRDITAEVEHKQLLENKIQEAQEYGEQLFEILENLPIPIALKNQRTQEYAFANKLARALYSLDGTLAFEVISSTLGDNFEARKRGGVYEAEEVLKLSDGRIMETMVRSTLVTYNKTKHALISCIDLTERKKEQQELQYLNTQRKIVLNNISSLLVHINEDYEVQWSNSSQILGPDLSYIYKEGTKCYESFGFNEPCPNCPAKEAMASGKATRKEINFIPDNNIYEAKAILVKENLGFDGVVMMLENVTEIKRLITDLVSTNKFMSTMITELPTPLFVKDVHDNLKYIFASTVFCEKIMNKSREEVIGFTDYEIFGADYQFLAEKCRQEDFELINNQEEGHVCIAEDFVKHKDEDIFLITRKIHLKLPNNKAYIIGQSSDVTEIQKINNELLIAKEKAEEAGKLKTAFLANMSHEIRTPLNAIVGFSELLKYAEDPEEKEEFMSIIDTNNELLLQLIGDILDLSKIESGTFEFSLETFDFNTLFHETYNTLKPRFQKSEVEFKEKSPFKKCIVTLDKNRCLQVLTNYLNNSLKFTEYGYIQMGYDYKEGGLLIYVKDTGIGIPKEKLDKLFQRFEKLNTFAQGTGLGLSICKAITEAMGGKVWVETVADKGSTFFAWIPCEAEIEKKEEVKPNHKYIAKRVESQQFSQAVERKNILVAEDNGCNYKLVQAILKDCNLTWAKNGEEAVKLAKQNKYDVLLMDMKMPVMDGLTATRSIRKFDTETPIIALTANAFDSDRADAFAAGCNKFVPKPIKRDDILSAIYGKEDETSL